MSVPSKCIFCKIINRSEKADILFENDELIIFRDIKPAAKLHILVVPKIHVNNAKSLRSVDEPLVTNMINAGKELIVEMGFNINDTISGFHWPPFNSIDHLHLHFINPASEMGLISKMIFKPNTWWFVTPDDVLSRISTDSHL